MSSLRVWLVVLSLVVLTCTSSLPLGSTDPNAYLRVVHVSVPENVTAGQAIVVSVTVEWSSLNVFYVWQGWDRPVIRVEVCEGSDVATCRSVAFAPSPEGEVVKPSGSATYLITVDAPRQSKVWHLIAIIEVLAAKTSASLRAIRRGDWAVVSYSGYDPWQTFEIPVLPGPDATVAMHTLFSESFESGGLVGWEQDGHVIVTDKNPMVSLQREGHTGAYAVMLGVSYSGSVGQFSLRRAVAVTPDSDLTVTFWYRGVYPYSSSGQLPRMLLTFSIISSDCVLDELTIQNTATEEVLTDDWRSMTRSVTVPSDVTSVTLKWVGTGDSQAAPSGVPPIWVGGYELDDIKVDERVFVTTTTSATSQTQTQSLTETTSSTSSSETESNVLEVWSDIWRTMWGDLLATWLAYAVVFAVVIALGAVVLTRRNRSRKTPPVTVFCTNCGASLPAGSTYCNRCGSKQ
jgi:hypothetical protein